MTSSKVLTHHGSCHCGKVKFTVRAPSALEIWRCNCSICTKKQNHHFIVPSSRFTLSPGSDSWLATYTFNTGRAKHMFCKKCGVQSFYVPRSNTDGVGVMPHCIDSTSVTELVYKDFDGKNWEECIETSDIMRLSKEPLKIIQKELLTPPPVKKVKLFRR